MLISSQRLISGSTVRLANAKVHVWHASLEQPLEVGRKLEAVLSEDERQRLQEFRDWNHRQSFVVRRGILRHLLSRYTGIQPEDIRFKYTPTGKPFLAGSEGTPDIRFNLSHAGLLVLYAFSWGRQAGIDVEVMRSCGQMDETTRRILSPNELKRFQGIGRELRLQVLYNAWTRKQAFAKARGQSLSSFLREVEVSFEPNLSAELLTVAASREMAKMWSMHDIKTWEGYCAALVVEGNDYSISNKQWTYTNLLPEQSG